MLPSNIISAFVIFLGCVASIIAAMFLAANGMLGAYLLTLVILGTIFALANNFPMLLGFVLWFPFGLPVTFMRGLPLAPIIMSEILVVALIRVAMTRSLRYVPSVTGFMLFCFAWVPIRYLMNPIHKLGAQISGGSGVSGLSAYYGYVGTIALAAVIGLVITSRERVVMTMIWSYRSCMFMAGLCLWAAFFSTGYSVYIWMGGFNAGLISGNIERIVLLPGYGLFILASALSPLLFRFPRWWAITLFFAGLAMIIIGGNRSAFIAAALLIVPLMLLNRRFLLAIVVVGSLAASILVSTVMIEHMDSTDIPGFARVLGVFSQRIDESEGGDASANWRYRVWLSGLQKIEQSPWVGHGYGHLPQHLDVSKMGNLTSSEADFEVVLAIGLSHNGFINAAYAFGIPFMLGLTFILLHALWKHTAAAIRIGSRDPPLREFHAFIASYLLSNFVLIYTAFDLGAQTVWFYVAVGILMFRVTRFDELDSRNPAPEPKPAFHPGELVVAKSAAT